MTRKPLSYLQHAFCGKISSGKWVNEISIKELHMKKSISGFKARRSDRFYEQSRSVLNMEIEFQMTHLKDSEIDFGNHRVAS